MLCCEAMYSASAAAPRSIAYVIRYDCTPSASVAAPVIEARTAKLPLRRKWLVKTSVADLAPPWR